MGPLSRLGAVLSMQNCLLGWEKTPTQKHNPGVWEKTGLRFHVVGPWSQCDMPTQGPHSCVYSRVRTKHGLFAFPHGPGKTGKVLAMGPWSGTWEKFFSAMPVCHDLGLGTWVETGNVLAVCQR